MEHSIGSWNIHPTAAADAEMAAKKDNDEVNDQQQDRDFARPSETTLESIVGFIPAAQNLEGRHESKPPSCTENIQPTK